MGKGDLALDLEPYELILSPDFHQKVKFKIADFSKDIMLCVSSNSIYRFVLEICYKDRVVSSKIIARKELASELPRFVSKELCAYQTSEIQISKWISKIKIYLVNRGYFEILDFKVLARKYKGLLVSITDDGIGMRLMNMMVSWYLANLAGYKFGFVWKSEINPCGTDDLRENLNYAFLR